MTEAALAGCVAGCVSLYFSPKYADRAAALSAAINRNGGMIIHTAVSEDGVPNKAVCSPVTVTTDVSVVADADVGELGRAAWCVWGGCAVGLLPSWQSCIVQLAPLPVVWLARW